MESSDPSCSQIPSILSSFVDAFVDFSVSGLFFPSSPNPNPNPNPSPLPTHIPAPRRLVAIGDLHGDLPKSLAALSLAGLADSSTGRWTGGHTVAVLLGDFLDRGGDELRLIHLLHRLSIEASRSGGAIHSVLGNHEVMNVDGDFRYVTREGLDEFRRWAIWFRAGLAMKRLCEGVPTPKDPFAGIPKSFPGIKQQYWEGFRARIAALRPDGPISTRFLSGNRTVLVVGDSVFVHGGLLETHIDYGLEKINREVRDWILGKNGRLSPVYMRRRNSLVWLRSFSEGFNCNCEHLEGILKMIPGAKRMVMGHTIQEDGINGVCEDKAIRIDVGLSKGCGDGFPEVLEISMDGKMTVLTANPLFNPRYRPEAERKEGLALLVPETGLKEVEVKA
ncbi:Metallo-dependent phosphatases protein [Dioscorea alata]|uniref:Metallo-dependent phosphatases protein n=1 Tax=Dioscorea alata TaxID=55571 RepID=A0ACB7W171_DIOAL|nr:Metallo-dependent phosphatases protein [Dioscorea alata]